MAKIYWLHGQPGSGKSSVGKLLQMWLQTEKANWRKTVFHIDEDNIKKLYMENHLENIATIAKFLLSTNHDVVVSAVTPSNSFREAIKDTLKVTEIYCHTKNIAGKDKNAIITTYEMPEKNFVDLDTTEDTEKTFDKLIKMLL